MNFKNKKIKRLFQYIPLLGFVLAVVSSCSTSQQLAGESDGIYFNPEKDQRVVYVSYEDTEYDDGNLVRIGGKYFDENGNAPTIENQKKYYKNNKQSKYSPWGNEENQTNVSINYMVSPFYSGFGFGFNYGYGNGWYDPFYYGGYSPYYYGMSSGYLWNNPYYYNPYSWDPFYSPYYNPYYRPYYRSPYNSPYYGNTYKAIPYKKSGADSIYRGRSNNVRRNSTRQNSYSRRDNFRNDSNSRKNSEYRRNNYSTPRNNNTNTGYRGSWIDRTPTRSTPMRSSTSSSSRNSGGFRTGAFR